MRIYIMRHGDAESPFSSGKRDSDRQLTETGRLAARSSALGLRALGCEVDVVLTSPYVRAQETAAIAAEVLGIAEPQIIYDLVPNGEVDDVLQAAASVSARGGILLVSHQPLCGLLMSQLLCTGDGVQVRFQTATVACVELQRLSPQGPSGQLVFFAPAALFGASCA
ncbi:phosphohistidine phosphatase SixA [Planctomycetota bacterium]